MRPQTPFAIEHSLSPALDRTLAYWRELLRGEATIPFADDVNMAKVEAQADNVFILGVFEKPRRFRLELVRLPAAPDVEAELAGRFIDEVDLPSPLQFLSSQAAAAAEGQTPTVYEHRPHGAERGYGRVLLPAWGEGHVSLLLGAVEFR